MRIALASLALAAAAIALGGCGSDEPTAAPPPAAVEWPPTGQVTAAPCSPVYPEGLERAQVAFAGTVSAVRVEDHVPKAGDARATVTFDVEESFAGSPPGTTTLKTWTFFLPDDPQQIVGSKVLVSTGEHGTGDVNGCGYSRPWTERDAQEWRAAFAAER